MKNVLVLKNSILGAASASNQLIDDAIAALKLSDSAAIAVRDLGVAPVPHLDGNAVVALRSEPENPDQEAARQLSDLLIAELQAADTIIIGAPMYNFGMPSTLKSWFDYILRAGVTFSYSEAGPLGLVTGKRAIVVLTRGGVYSEGPAVVMDSHEPHIRNLLAFIGITDVQFVRAEGLAMGPEARERGLSTAKAGIENGLDLAMSVQFKAAS
ncbi:FMN-dependent NADH-azoreductase [Sinorhizobium meliloti]|uniref:FMN-dependent NADH-azoreductase n=1 Tax=Rhizobium meliloti TaxID=382 RepID=UPI000FDA637D|nr:NAD(P)H-dependent oxidoreductase [Sinorhizobium meliloti]RVK59218.1 FMN-dependent NADH-azoreductase [Sinorhizobium meliloti]